MTHLLRRQSGCSTLHLLSHSRSVSRLGTTPAHLMGKCYVCNCSVSYDALAAALPASTARLQSTPSPVRPYVITLAFFLLVCYQHRLLPMLYFHKLRHTYSYLDSVTDRWVLYKETLESNCPFDVEERSSLHQQQRTATMPAHNADDNSPQQHGGEFLTWFLLRPYNNIIFCRLLLSFFSIGPPHDATNR